MGVSTPYYRARIGARRKPESHARVRTHVLSRHWEKANELPMDISMDMSMDISMDISMDVSMDIGSWSRFSFHLRHLDVSSLEERHMDLVTGRVWRPWGQAWLVKTKIDDLIWPRPLGQLGYLYIRLKLNPT